MIISRTPLRISFAGGGTDLPSYYRQYGGGEVVSAAIDRYIYVLVNEKFDEDIRVSYSRTAEYVSRVEDVRHPMVREAMRASGVTKAVEIVTISDIPAEGTGLGSSSSFAVGILNALYAFRGELRSPRELAEEACHIEIDVLGEPIGKQDQYAAAFGGVQHYIFRPDDGVDVHPLPLAREDRERLSSYLSLYYSGLTRSAGSILQEQNRRTSNNRENLEAMKELARQTRDAILARDFERLGALLHEGWERKKRLSQGVTNPVLDDLYRRAREAGALGGKVTGAGGGGFLLIAAPPQRAPDIERAMSPIKRVPVRITTEGSRIIFVGR
jgi:D-glycero-alpha-D-manno-heptose-7-phosphate kinase